MKKIVTLFIALVASFGTVFAAGGACGDNLTWNLSHYHLLVDGIGSMPDFLYGGAPWGEYRKSVRRLDMSDGITNIGKAAFYDCSNLTYVIIPNSITSIGEGAFYECSGLETLIMSNSVTSIGRYAFEGCIVLTSITIPESVIEIGSDAFYGCTGLTSITCEATSPPTCGETVFYEIDKSSIPLYVPAESIEAYKAADQWKDFKRILPLSTTGSEEMTNDHGSADRQKLQTTNKFLRNGVMYILRDGKTYNIQGAQAE